MTRAEEAAEQTDIRRGLLTNGYTPLANKDKMCVLRGWSDIYVDDAKIDEWSQQLKWRATGVRIERGLAVIDLDVNDDDAIAAIIDAIPADIWAILQDAPVRRGKGAKEAWFVRLADGEQPFYRLASAGFRQQPGDETVHRVEIFAGEGGGRQFGAYGAHTIGPDDHPSVIYQWTDGRGLIDVPFDDLPRLTRSQLSTIGEVASRTLEAIGWHHDRRSKQGFSSNRPIYDLADQKFETRDHGEVDLAQLEDLCAAGDEVRLSASWLEGPSAVNMTRCIASLHPRDGRVSILETASFAIHRPVDLDVGVKLSRLHEQLVARGFYEAFEQSNFWQDAPSTGDTMSRHDDEITALPVVRVPAGGLAAAVVVTAAHLAKAPDIFDYGNQVALVREKAICVMGQDRFAHELGLRFRFLKPTPMGGMGRVDPPLDLVKQLLALGPERRLKKLLGLINNPVVLPDGTLLSLAGYDSHSQLYLAPAWDRLPEISSQPSHAELSEALETLWHPFKQFPFVSAAARGGMLAALLTAVIRKVLPTAPAFAFDAPTQGSGKTLLANCVGELAGGAKLMAPLPAKNEEEVAKVLLSVLLDTPRAVIFDNQLGSLDSASFAAVLTSPKYEGRILGVSKTAELPTNTVFMLTGNNLIFGGDMPRRIVNIRVDAEQESPFTRAFDLNPLAHVRENRLALCVAAVTLILGAFPQSVPGRLGSFEDWDRLVAQTVAWVGVRLSDGQFGDPMQLVSENHADDPHREELHDLLVALRSTFGNQAFTAKEVRDVVSADMSRGSVLRDNLEGICNKITANSIGLALKYRVGRRVAGLHLTKQPNPKASNTFRVVSVDDIEGVQLFGSVHRSRGDLAAELLSIVPKKA